ncbi:MAG: DegT/DnrJ/EryC1/StrS family aminotransferase [Terriglobia bacterium]
MGGICSEVSERSRRPAFWKADDARVPSHRLEARTWDLVVALAWAAHPDPLSRLRDALKAQTERQHILFAPSGRCAIAQILSFLPQQEVVMPAHLCHEVKKAAEVAGKRIIYVDLAKNSVNSTSAEFAEAAKPGRILLPAHALGVPTDIEAICKLAVQRDCVVVEDAAAAFGARRAGRLLGTFGDVGVFSFERSKRFGAFRGGAIVVNNVGTVDPTKLGATRVAESTRALPIRELLEALARNVATNRRIFRGVALRLLPLRDSLQGLWRRRRRAQGTVAADQRPDVPRAAFYTREFHPYQAELMLRMLGRMDEIRGQIARLAAVYLEAFRDSGVSPLLPPDCDYGGLTRVPVAFRGKDRNVVLRLALKRGLYLKTHWERPLPDESEWGRFPNAVWAARNIVMLPLYSRLPLKSAQSLACQLAEVVRDAPPAP